MSDKPRWACPAWAAMLFGWVGLHALTSVSYPWEPSSALARWTHPSPDFFALLTVAYLLAPGGTLPRLLQHALVIAFLSIPVFRFGITVTEVFHGRPLDLFNDVLLVPGLVHLVLHPYSLPVQIVICIGSVLGAVAAYALVLLLIRCSLRGAADVRWRAGFLATALLLFLAGIGLGWTGPVEDSGEAGPDAQTGGLWSAAMLPTVAEKTLEMHSRWKESRFFGGLLERTEQEVAGLPKDLGGLDGADVYLVFIESYGRTVFRTPRTAEVMAGWAAEWEAQLAAEGIAVRSGAGYPSVRGGASSLAHAELLCGVQIPNYRSFDRLLSSPLDPLPAILSRAGYHTVNAQPAMYQAWPDGAFFGFDEDFFLDRFPYHGHEYHWGTMPDQFALNHLLETLVEPSRKPLFVQYISVTSHAPFTKVPPYFEDWEVLSDPSVLELGPARTFPIEWGNYRGHPDLETAYLESLRYSLQVLIDFTVRLPRTSLVILVGDHQPPGLTELEMNDRTYDIPIHVLSRDERLLAPFAAADFEPGLVPPPDYEAFSTSQFIKSFLRAFSLAGGQ